MKKKIIFFGVLVVLVALLAIIVSKNVDIKDTEEQTSISNEYVPEEEISDEQNRMTIVTLYFVDHTTGNLVHEARNLDVKDLLEDPYGKVINFLIDGSEDENIGKTIPEGTVLNGTVVNGEELCIDFNDSFVKDRDVNSEEFRNIVYSIVDSCLEFKDISSVRFLINGEKYSGLEEQFKKRN